MRMLFLVLVCSCLSLKATAMNLTGEWVGSGRYLSSDGLNNDCPNIAIEFQQTENELFMSEWQFKCNAVDGDMEKGGLYMREKLMIKGQGLYFGNDKVGTLEKNKIGREQATWIARKKPNYIDQRRVIVLSADSIQFITSGQNQNESEVFSMTLKRK